MPSYRAGRRVSLVCALSLASCAPDAQPEPGMAPGAQYSEWLVHQGEPWLTGPWLTPGPDVAQETRSTARVGIRDVGMCRLVISNSFWLSWLQSGRSRGNSRDSNRGSRARGKRQSHQSGFLPGTVGHHDKLSALGHIGHRGPARRLREFGHVHDLAGRLVERP